MAYKPKRRKSKDNPYTLDFNELEEIYIVSFKDNKNVIHKVTVSDKVFNVLDKFELEDISQMHEYERHREHSELYEETLNKRILDKPISLEEEVEKKILNEKLREVISTLPEIQKKRLIKYYFENKTFEQIAKEENCTKRAVKFSIDIALEKISKKIKN